MINTLGLTDELLLEDASRELDIEKVSNDARYLAARLEYVAGRAVSRLLFWFVWAPAALALFAFVFGLVLRK